LAEMPARADILITLDRDQAVTGLEFKGKAES
jgi:hypothetical protein